MEEELKLVSDLALILISAGIFTIISKALKQPLVLGYIIAGLLVGPHVGIFPNVTDTASVEQWSEIGIIFMMFALGLEFSFKNLVKVGSSALLIAGCKFIGLFIVGFGAGVAMGWTTMESVFLGGLLSMSSTAVVIKAYEDMGLKNKPFAATVFGTLVVEDIIAILLMVVFPTVAVAGTFSGGEMILNLAKMAFFLILWFLIGIVLIPLIFRKAKKVLNDEILLIVSIGLCFGMVAFANAVHLSSALGAFVMGSILAETLEGEHILKLTGSIKNLFSAIFFVSVGMMIDPLAILHNWLPVLVITLLVIIGHIIFASSGAILAGKGLHVAVNTGFSLSQLGEFGFILAGVGCSLGVMRDFTYPVIVAVSVITTFTTPYMIKLAGPCERMLRSKLSPKLLAKMEPAPENTGKDSAAAKNMWKVYIQSYVTRIVLYSVVIIAILILSDTLLVRLMDKIFPTMQQNIKDIITAAITVVPLFFFVYGLGSVKGKEGRAAKKLIEAKASNQWTIKSLIFLRVLLSVAYLVVAIAIHVQLSGWIVLVILVLGVPAFLLMHYALKKHKINITRFETQFLKNLSAKEAEAMKQAPVTTEMKKTFEGYDVHLEPFSVSADSSFVGRSLKDIPFRSETGVSIVKIERGSKTILVPAGNEILYPGDRILAVGTKEQLDAFKLMVAASVAPTIEGAAPASKFTIEEVVLKEDSILTGHTLREVDMRSYGCLVLATLRDDKFTTNPKADYRFVAGDTVWFAGEEDSIKFIS